MIESVNFDSEREIKTAGKTGWWSNLAYKTG